jgi:molecular chaperone DnaK (HSP70)
VHLYSEPVAAARAYMDIQAGNFLVLDYGGGTLDINVIRMSKPGSVGGNEQLCKGFPEGGARIDEAVLNFCLSKGGYKLQEWYLKQNLRPKLRIKRNVEAAKIKLSTESEAYVEFAGSEVDPVRITQSDLSHALQNIMSRMIATVSSTIVTLLGRIEEVQFVVLSGGTSLSPVVQNAVLAIFQHIPQDRFIVPSARNPGDVETCLCAVSKGLALLLRDGVEPFQLPVKLSHRTFDSKAPAR